MSVQFPTVTHSMLRVSWVPGANDVPGHRITYSTNHGSDVKQVICLFFFPFERRTFHLIYRCYMNEDIVSGLNHHTYNLDASIA